MPGSHDEVIGNEDMTSTKSGGYICRRHIADCSRCTSVSVTKFLNVVHTGKSVQSVTDSCSVCVKVA